MFLGKKCPGRNVLNPLAAKSLAQVPYTQWQIQELSKGGPGRGFEI